MFTATRTIPILRSFLSAYPAFQSGPPFQRSTSLFTKFYNFERGRPLSFRVLSRCRTQQWVSTSLPHSSASDRRPDSMCPVSERDPPIPDVFFLLRSSVFSSSIGSKIFLTIFPRPKTTDFFSPVTLDVHVTAPHVTRFQYVYNTLVYEQEHVHRSLYRIT